MTTFCTKCGAQNDPSANFCEQCGASLQRPIHGATKDVSIPTAKPSVPLNVRRTLIALLVLVGITIAGVSAWQFLNPNRPSEATFAKVLNQHYAGDKTAVDEVVCLTNTQYSRNPILANPWDSRMKDWMGMLVSAGLYTGPTSVVSGGGFFAREQIKYERTELGNKAVRDGKLCFADGVKVVNVLSFTAPRKQDSRDTTLVTYGIEFVNPAAWVKLAEVQEKAKSELGPEAMRKQATLALGEKGWEWVGEGNRVARLSEEEPSQDSGKGVFSGIQSWFGGGSTAPDVVVKGFYHAVESGNVDAAMAAMSSLQRSAVRKAIFYSIVSCIGPLNFIRGCK